MCRQVLGAEAQRAVVANPTLLSIKSTTMHDAWEALLEVYKDEQRCDRIRVDCSHIPTATCASPVSTSIVTGLAMLCATKDEPLHRLHPPRLLLATGWSRVFAWMLMIFQLSAFGPTSQRLQRELSGALERIQHQSRNLLPEHSLWVLCCGRSARMLLLWSGCGHRPESVFVVQHRQAWHVCI
jgi:hypothetical protein